MIDGVDQPAKKQFCSAPTAIVLEEILDGDGFLVELVSRIHQRANDLVDGMEEDAMGNTSLACVALD